MFVLFSTLSLWSRMSLQRKACFLMIFSFLLFAQGIAGQLPENQQTHESAWQEPKMYLDSGVFGPDSEYLLTKLTPMERKWYHRFQEGIPLFAGWKKITQAVVEKFPEHEREGRLAAMQALGVKIGYEWSRDNRVRKVSTETLRAWGQDLRKAGSENHVQLANVLYKIDNEVNQLLKIK